MTSTQERSVPKPVFTDAEAGAKTFPDSTKRAFNYFTPDKRKPSRYEDVTVEVQPDPRHYLSQGWLYGFSDGRGGYPLDWTALKAWGSDRPEPERYPGSGGKGYDWPATGWHLFRDPNEEWELTLYRYNSNVVRQLNQNVDAARQAKAFSQWNPNWVRFVESHVGAWMHVDHGLGLYLYANANRRAPTTVGVTKSPLRGAACCTRPLRNSSPTSGSKTTLDAKMASHQSSIAVSCSATSRTPCQDGSEFQVVMWALPSKFSISSVSVRLYRARSWAALIRCMLLTEIALLCMFVGARRLALAYR